MERIKRIKRIGREKDVEKERRRERERERERVRAISKQEDPKPHTLPRSNAPN